MSSSSKKYDVFISFRGEDTRRGFTSHLHTALCKQNIEAFIDNNLNKGDEVWPELAEAIQSSDISIVVFSVNYASSKWCLEELREIQRCRKNQGQVVMPVFYKIDPSEVRKQTNIYETAFTKHERDLQNNESSLEKVSQWRDALTESANISGWDSRNYKDESEVIENIVNDVWKKLSLKYPNELKGLIDIDENKKSTELLLNKFSRIGIWGMGGSGKTTIAREMFAKHFAQYNSACFLENVREESKRFGLKTVRDKLLSELCKTQISTDGHTFLPWRRSDQKVFIVIDDVANTKQLEDLCEELGDLGPHSRLIITTRDRHVISKMVDKIYKVPKWNVPKSLELFSLGAFGRNHLEEGYEHLSKRAVACAGGVPLALKVLGLHFRGRDTEFWESALSKLEKLDLEDIQEVLRVSYDGLSKQERTIFLDVAFFFKNEDKDFVIRILDACGFNATSGIEILTDKALITISDSKRIQMHDLLQKMALDIVEEESKYPRKRSRLRDIENVCDVLENSNGTEAVEGITSDLSGVDLYLQANTFNTMTNIRFLRLYAPLCKQRSGTVNHPRFLERCDGF